MDGFHIIMCLSIIQYVNTDYSICKHKLFNMSSQIIQYVNTNLILIVVIFCMINLMFTSFPDIIIFYLLICDLCSGAVSSLDCVMTAERVRVHNEVDRMKSEMAVP